MFRRLYRQRRRILLFALLFTLAVVLQMVSGDGYWYQSVKSADPESFRTVAGLFTPILFLLMAGMAAVVVLILPDFRGALELVALTTFAVHALRFALPEPFRWEAGSAVNAVFFIASYVIVYQILHGHLLDRFGWAVKQTRRTDFVTSATPEAVWNATVPSAETVDTYWSGGLASVRPADEPDMFEVRYRLGKGAFETQTMSYLALERPHHARYYFALDVSEAQSRYSDGTFDIRITPRPDGQTQVELTRIRHAIRPAEAFMRWIEDDLGGEADAIRARLEDRRDWSLQGRFWRGIAKTA